MGKVGHYHASLEVACKRISRKHLGERWVGASAETTWGSHSVADYTIVFNKVCDICSVNRHKRQRRRSPR